MCVCTIEPSSYECSCVCALLSRDRNKEEPKGRCYLKPPKFEHIFLAVITFFPLSSVQILLIPVC